ncbi:hypothetical protein NNC19_10345 [Clostridium sp. SHJSY1]|nr:hypothetical protein [Clostridium sp. SHJSY1]MDS0526080.1 hypothetical protein [Clostridium sp. SHJSY1]
MKISVSFKETEEEKELLEYLKKKGKIIGISSYIKQIVYEEMLKEKAAKK